MARLGFLKSTTSRGPTGATQRWPPYLRRARTLRGWQPGPPRLPGRDRGHEHNALLFPAPSVQVDRQLLIPKIPFPLQSLRKSAAARARSLPSISPLRRRAPRFSEGPSNGYHHVTRKGHEHSVPHRLCCDHSVAKRSHAGEGRTRFTITHGAAFTFSVENADFFSCHGRLDMPRDPISRREQRRIDLVNVAFSYACPGVTYHRLDCRNGVSEILGSGAEGMTQALTGNSGHVFSRYLL